MPEFDKFRVDPEFAERMEQHIEGVLNELTEGLDAEDLDDIPETPSYVPFCGCGVCVTRETIVMAVELTLEGVRLGLIEPIGNET